MNVIWKSIPNSGSIKSKSITKLFDRFMNRRVELSNDKEIITTLITTGTIRTDIERKLSRKILKKNCLKKLISEVLKNVQNFQLPLAVPRLSVITSCRCMVSYVFLQLMLFRHSVSPANLNILLYPDAPFTLHAVCPTVINFSRW